MTDPKKFIKYSIVVPVYNSEKSLLELYTRLTDTMEALRDSYEIIFVEDCSSDGSWNILKELVSKDDRLVAIQLMHNSGQGMATLTGLAHSTGEFCITLDDDLQHPPEEVTKLIGSIANESEIDVVMGVPEKKRHNIVRRMGSFVLSIINTSFLGKQKGIRLSSFRIMRRCVVEILLSMRFPYPAIGSMLTLATKRIINIIVKHESRKFGKSNYNVRRIMQMLFSNLIGYSIMPLHLMAVLGLVGVIGCAVTGTYFLIRYFLVGVGVQGWTSLMLVLIVLSGFNFFAFAIIGEYLIRLFKISSLPIQYHVRNCLSRER